jgi:hypothetical protein
LIFQFPFTDMKEFSRMMRISVPFVGLMLMFLCNWAALTVAQAEYMKYKDPKHPMNGRIKDLMGRMTLAEKIGQMVQVDHMVATPEIMRDYSLGSILSGGGSVPRPQATAQDWLSMVNEFQNGSLSTRLGIPMIYGIDAVHGHNNVYKATIFPHNVGLGATRQVYIYCFCIIVSHFVFRASIVKSFCRIVLRVGVFLPSARLYF